MIDAEVLRLRKLRNVALRARALAKILDSDSVDGLEGQSVFARSCRHLLDYREDRLRDVCEPTRI